TFRFEAKQVQQLRLRLVPLLLQLVDSSSSEARRTGSTLFISSGCVGCHGPAGEGTGWGPSLRGCCAHYSARQLATMLADSGSEMRRRARTWNGLWPAL